MLMSDHTISTQPLTMRVLASLSKGKVTYATVKLALHNGCHPFFLTFNCPPNSHPGSHPNE